ncbi:di-heme-cytochrome C peroxidase [Teredinibacter turnerae]|uniref:di-heme-cytochrome C peroxidase n=1 Tax=Teredinibacter turnerae TaxID=2426 RepID=UPI000372019B|nr:di-heme-cytochrome C peroxidase [Teredinibacter turnerae]
MRWKISQYRTKLSLRIFLLSLALVAGCVKSPRIYDVQRHTVDDAVSLPQNWTPATRDHMNQLSFGSRLIPYEWFYALEQADSDTRFFSHENIQKLGFIPRNVSEQNADGLPIGFVADEWRGEKWLGLTCTACHTGQLHFRGQTLLIEGAPGMFDFQAFEKGLFRALQVLLTDNNKYQRFTRQLQPENPSELIAALNERVRFMHARLKANRTTVPYGYGRLDAFGQIFNAVSAAALELPDNKHSADAPVSVPVLWDASHLDVVQWNASAVNKEPGPLGQNVTTALAVYGTLELDKQTLLGYSNSVNIRNLGTIQRHYYDLMSPQWPEDILGPINTGILQTGAVLYQSHCASCHAVIDSRNPKRKLRATVVPQNIIGTDPVMTENFAAAKARTGKLEGRKIVAGIRGSKLPAIAPTLDIVTHLASSVMANRPLASINAIMTERQPQYQYAVDRKALNYKARPLNGLWASAPFLHNGSVPTIYDLLLPAAERPKAFLVGDVEFDPHRLGLSQSGGTYRSTYDTTLYGNSNQGHEIATHLSDEDRLALLEYLKTL